MAQSHWWLLILVGVVGCVPLTLDVPAYSIYPVNNNTLRESLYTGEQYFRPLEDLHFEFSSQVYERGDALSDNILDDFEGQILRNSTTYAPSKKCWMEPTEVKFERVASSGEFADGVDAYLFDGEYGMIILSGRQLVYYIVGKTDEIRMIKYAQYTMWESLNSSQAQFARLANRIYLTDGHSFYKLSVDTTHSAETALLQIEKVEGFEPLQSYEVFVRVLEIDPTRFMVVTFTKMVVYEFKDELTLKRNPYLLPEELNGRVSEFVDGATANDSIYLLDAKTGLVVLPLSALDTYMLVELNFGRNLKLEVSGRTIEVICSYHKKLFVAELLVRNGVYVLNRFYNQIEEPRDIDFYDDKALLMGEHEILIIGHSINRNALTQLDKQYFKTYPSNGVKEFEVLRPFSKDSTAVLVGVSRSEAVVMRVGQTVPLLRCNFNDVSAGTYTFVVEIHTSVCGTFTYSEWSEKHRDLETICRTRYPVVFQLNTPFQAKSRNFISVSSAAMWLVAVLLVLGAAAKWGTRMNNILRSLRNEITKKRISSKNKSFAGSTVNMLGNAVS